jgi:hypothetical protein
MTTDMCQHITEASLPMVLVHTETTNAFTCPSCCADYCIALLDAGTPAAHVLETLIFEACDHTEGTCKRCLESLKDELSKRWMVCVRLTPSFFDPKNVVNCLHD